MHKLVHLCNPLIVFLESTDLTDEEIVFFVSHLKVLLETLNICAQRLILICKLDIKVLLEVHISLHIGHFAVPEIKFISLHGVVLLHQDHSLGHISLLIFFFFDTVLQRLHTPLQGLFVGIKSGSQGFSPLSLLLGSDLLLLELLQTLVDFALLS